MYIPEVQVELHFEICPPAKYIFALQILQLRLNILSKQSWKYQFDSAVLVQISFLSTFVPPPP